MTEIAYLLKRIWSIIKDYTKRKWICRRKTHWWM